jgi:gliding motility-associated-like protein
VNEGCPLNIDSVKIHTVGSQVLISNNLITPNHDGMNEKLIVTDINTNQAILPGSTLEIYNRWGEKIFKSESYDNSWEATG